MGLFCSPVDARLGFQLRCEDSVVLKFIRFSMFVADEVALKETFQFKGAAGVQICPLCTNIVSEASELHRFSDRLLPSSSVEPSQWQRANSESIKAKIRRLHDSAGCTTRQAFEGLEKR